MSPLLLIALVCANPPGQEAFKEEVTIKGMHIYARCWRTPTGKDPYMIWTIASRDDAPAGQHWRIRGESIAFAGLAIDSKPTFSEPVSAKMPDSEVGFSFQQAGGESATVAFVRGQLQRVETLTERVALSDLSLVAAARQPGGNFGTVYHFRIDKALDLETPSGLHLAIPRQGADTRMPVLSLSVKPTAALLIRPSFGSSEEKLARSSLWQRFGGPIDIEMSLYGVGNPSVHGFSGRDYIVESEGLDLKPGGVQAPGIEVTQSVVLESYPLDFRIPVRETHVKNGG